MNKAKFKSKMPDKVEPMLLESFERGGEAEDIFINFDLDTYNFESYAAEDYEY